MRKKLLGSVSVVALLTGLGVALLVARPGLTAYIPYSLGVYNSTQSALTSGTATPLQTGEFGDLRVQPLTAAKVSGTASQATGGTSTLLVTAVSSRRLYITAFACANTGSTASLVSFQDGSGGTTLYNTIVPAGGGSNLSAGGSPLFWTTSGNGLYYDPATSTTTTYCSASGFSDNN
jgi:hypothetical protein